MPELSDLAAITGRSLVDAQSQLGGPSAGPTTMAVADAQVEMRVAVELDNQRLRVRPMGIAEAASGKVDAATLSTVKMNFVAVSAIDPARSEGPRSDPARVVDSVARRDDLVELRKAVGELHLKADYVAAQGSWLVTATSARGTPVRRVVVVDGDV